ncbi:hypothetical protein K9904_004131 [Salmonella enterica subsp. enterica serovar Javiana]|nr:hypothetical protein [Salmonella enterica subsp. enterica serovar Javiana]
MDVFSGIAAAKQAYELIKLITNTRDQAVINKAAGELSEKITELQITNAELAGLYQAERDVTVKLREENNKIEMFSVQAENYDIYTTEGGSTVYRSKKTADSVVPHYYLCTHCFSEYKISILQPSIETIKSMGFFVHQCPRCKNEYRMNKVPPLPDIHVPPLSRW